MPDATPPAASTAPSEGGPVAPSQRRLTPAERDQLIAQVRLAFQYQRTMWKVLRTGISLGAEEVQDQRLLAAETPPEANPALDVFVFVLMWAVEGPLAATITRGVQRMVLSGLQRQMRLQTTAYRSLVAMEAARTRPALDEARRIAAARTQRGQKRLEAAKQGGASREARARTAIERGEAAQRELERLEAQFPSADALNAQSGLRQTALALRGMRRQDLPDYIVAVPNIALQQPIRFPQPTPEPGVSPGVTLRAQVEKQALELIQESYFQQELYETTVRDEQLTAARAAGVFEDIGVQTRVDIGALLDHYRLAAAALVWAQLLEVSGLRSRRLAEQDAARRTLTRFAGDPLPPYGALFTTREQHRKYLIARFGTIAEAWARNAPGDVLLPGPYPLPAALPISPAVEGYLRAGQGTAPRGIVESVLDLRTDPADLRLDLVLQWLSALAEQAPEMVLRTSQA